MAEGLTCWSVTPSHGSCRALSSAATALALVAFPWLQPPRDDVASRQTACPVTVAMIWSP
jgi:hypothetical protein